MRPIGPAVQAFWFVVVASVAAGIGGLAAGLTGLIVGVIPAFVGWAVLFRATVVMAALMAAAAWGIPHPIGQP